jgi:cell pole-organizing protein PopZ
MSQTAKVQEPSMEEILASIRRIIADDDGRPKAPEPVAPPAAVAAPSRPAPVPPPAAANNQDDIDAMLADLDAPPKVAAKPALMPAPKPAPMPAPMLAPMPAAPPADVLDLTEAMAAPEPTPAPSFRTIDGANDVVFTDPPEQRPEPPVRAEPRPQVAQQPASDQGLISNATVSAVDSAFNSLAYTVIGQNARTLEDLVKEMLRPLLKSWLDDNLPGMVERIVRAEIERVSRGGRQ